jgi:hypothetical protein
MSTKGKRKAYGMSKKHACDLHHCKKKKKEPAYKGLAVTAEIKHSRVDTRQGAL